MNDLTTYTLSLSYRSNTHLLGIIYGGTWSFTGTFRLLRFYSVRGGDERLRTLGTKSLNFKTLEGVGLLVLDST